MELLKTFLAGLAVLTGFAYFIFLFFAFAYTVTLGFDWYTALAIPGWATAAVGLILGIGSIVRDDQDEIGW